MPNFEQNLCIQERFCDTIHGLHPCDNCDAFNTNIEDFIGKNSEKITNNQPTISYIKVKNPEKLNWSYLQNKVEF